MIRSNYIITCCTIRVCLCLRLFRFARCQSTCYNLLSILSATYSNIYATFGRPSHTWQFDEWIRLVLAGCVCVCEFVYWRSGSQPPMECSYNSVFERTQTHRFTSIHKCAYMIHLPHHGYTNIIPHMCDPRSVYRCYPAVWLTRHERHTHSHTNTRLIIWIAVRECMYESVIWSMSAGGAVAKRGQRFGHDKFTCAFHTEAAPTKGRPLCFSCNRTPHIKATCTSRVIHLKFAVDWCHVCYQSKYILKYPWNRYRFCIFLTTELHKHHYKLYMISDCLSLRITIDEHTYVAWNIVMFILVFS